MSVPPPMWVGQAAGPPEHPPPSRAELKFATESQDFTRRRMLISPLWTRHVLSDNHRAVQSARVEVVFFDIP